MATPIRRHVSGRRLHHHSPVFAGLDHHHAPGNRHRHLQGAAVASDPIRSKHYVQVFRNTPFLVQLFFWYFAAPLLLPKPAQEWLYNHVPDYSYWAGVTALGTYTASRLAEQFRAGLLSIPRDQYRAAYSTGLTTFQTYRYVIVPYAFRIIIPPFTTEFLTCFKNSALTMTIGVMEITHTAYYVDSFTWHGLETTTAASLTYLFISGCVVLFMWFVEKRLHIPGMIARGR